MSRRCVVPVPLQSSPGQLSSLRVLSGKKLVCHCLPHQPCHGDVIIAAFLATQIDPNTAGDFTAKVGILRTPDEHIKDASVVQHPFTALSADDRVKTAVLDTLREGPTATVRSWKATLDFWKQRAAELEPRERQPHQGMASDVAKVLEGKRLLLFGEMLKQADFPNADRLIHRMSTGFEVVGDL